MASPIFTIISFSLISFLSSTVKSDKPTPYEALKTFNFPAGILPKGALGYDLDESSGKFRAYLSGSCKFSLQGSYELKYKPVIMGTISQNRLVNLSGVSVKVLFLWLNIVEVSRVGDELGFSVGIASATFGVDEFFESPQCGCGFDCSSSSSNDSNNNNVDCKMNSLDSSI